MDHKKRKKKIEKGLKEIDLESIKLEFNDLEKEVRNLDGLNLDFSDLEEEIKNMKIDPLEDINIDLELEDLKLNLDDLESPIDAFKREIRKE